MDSEERIKEIITSEIVEEWVAEGHSLTGDTINTIKYSVEGDTLSAYINKYAVYQSRGVPASDIPYSGNGGGGKSLYIQGLINYVKLRIGKPGKEGIGIAFAIARKHKEVGMQIRTKGAGTGWLDKAEASITPKIFGELTEEWRKLIKVKI